MGYILGLYGEDIGVMEKKILFRVFLSTQAAKLPPSATPQPPGAAAGAAKATELHGRGNLGFEGLGLSGLESRSQSRRKDRMGMARQWSYVQS